MRLIHYLDDCKHIAAAMRPTRIEEDVRPAIDTILEPRFTSLRDLEIVDGAGAIDLVLDLASLIELPRKGRKTVGETSATVSKALLATLGCVPSFDRTSIAGMRACGLQAGGLDAGSLAEVFHWARRNSEEIAAARDALAAAGVYCPDMKLVDTHFWNLGLQVRRRQTATDVRRSAQPIG